MGNEIIIERRKKEGKTPDLFIKIKHSELHDGTIITLNYIKVQNRNAIVIYFMSILLLAEAVTEQILNNDKFDKSEKLIKIMDIMMTARHMGEYMVKLDKVTEIDLGMIMFNTLPLMFPEGDRYMKNTEVSIVYADDLENEVIVHTDDYPAYAESLFHTFTAFLAETGLIDEQEVMLYNLGPMAYLVANKLKFVYQEPADLKAMIEKNFKAKLTEVRTNEVDLIGKERYKCISNVFSINDISNELVKDKVVVFQKIKEIL